MANNLNSVLVDGHLVRDPEMRDLGNGAGVCHFSLASNRRFKSEKEKEHQEEVSYFDIEVWSKLADRCERFLEKGLPVRVVGRLKQDRWTDKNGQNRSKIKIIGEQVDFLSWGKKGKGEGKNNAKAEAPREEPVPTY